MCAARRSSSRLTAETGTLPSRSASTTLGTERATLFDRLERAAAPRCRRRGARAGDLVARGQLRRDALQRPWRAEVAFVGAVASSAVQRAVSSTRDDNSTCARCATIRSGSDACSTSCCSVRGVVDMHALVVSRFVALLHCTHRSVSGFWVTDAIRELAPLKTSGGRAQLLGCRVFSAPRVRFCPFRRPQGTSEPRCAVPRPLQKTRAFRLASQALRRSAWELLLGGRGSAFLKSRRTRVGLAASPPSRSFSDSISVRGSAMSRAATKAPFNVSISS